MPFAESLSKFQEGERLAQARGLQGGSHVARCACLLQIARSERYTEDSAGDWHVNFRKQSKAYATMVMNCPITLPRGGSKYQELEALYEQILRQYQSKLHDEDLQLLQKAAEKDQQAAEKKSRTLENLRSIVGVAKLTSVTIMIPIDKSAFNMALEPKTSPGTLAAMIAHKSRTWANIHFYLLRDWSLTRSEAEGCLKPVEWEIHERVPNNRLIAIPDMVKPKIKAEILHDGAETRVLPAVKTVFQFKDQTVNLTVYIKETNGYLHWFQVKGGLHKTHWDPNLVLDTEQLSQWKRYGIILSLAEADKSLQAQSRTRRPEPPKNEETIATQHAQKLKVPPILPTYSTQSQSLAHQPNRPPVNSYKLPAVTDSGVLNKQNIAKVSHTRIIGPKPNTLIPPNTRKSSISSVASVEPWWTSTVEGSIEIANTTIGSGFGRWLSADGSTYRDYINASPDYTALSISSDETNALLDTKTSIATAATTSHNGARILSSSDACLRCASMNSYTIMQRLNTLLGTRFSLNSEKVMALIKSPWIQGVDFGTAYALVRQLWPETQNGFDTLLHTIKTRESHASRLAEAQARECFGDDEQESSNGCKSLGSNSRTMAIAKQIRPRRLWDLHANRVVPYHYSRSHDFKVANVQECYWTITHSWTEEMVNGEHFIWTSINSKEWRVPVPDDVDIEGKLREELLEMGAEYIWLDVLCLRQCSVSPNRGNNELQKQEWELDIPTIGFVYWSSRQTVRYLNGLGRPYDCTQWDSQRHWSKRVWTVQEAWSNVVDGGLPDLQESKERALFEIENQLSQILKIQECHRDPESSIGYKFLLTLEEIRSRNCSNPVDRVCVITTMFCSSKFPIYRASETIESAWSRCIPYMSPVASAELLFSFACPGTSFSWRPDWRQLMNPEVEIREENGSGIETSENTLTVSQDGLASYTGPSFEGSFSVAANHKGIVVLMENVYIAVNWRGDLDLKAQQPYVFVGNPRKTLWVVCTKYIVPPGEVCGDVVKLGKVAVVQMEPHQIDRLHGQVQEKTYVFV